MGQEPDAIRQDIERTRTEMSETVEAIGYRADVPARTKDAVGEKVDGVKERLGLARDKVSDATPSTGDVKGAGKQAVGVAKANPLGLALGGVAVGILAGMLIPETRKEHELLGEHADNVKEAVVATGQEALEHGKQVAEEVAGQVTETAQTAAQEIRETATTAAQEHGQEVKETAMANAHDAAPTT